MSTKINGRGKECRVVCRFGRVARGQWNRSNQESKFDFLAIRQRRVKIDEGLGWCQEREKFTRFLPINFLPLPAP